jgi:hypothetical protein
MEVQGEAFETAADFANRPVFLVASRRDCEARGERNQRPCVSARLARSNPKRRKASRKVTICRDGPSPDPSKVAVRVENVDQFE